MQLALSVRRRGFYTKKPFHKREAYYIAGYQIVVPAEAERVGLGLALVRIQPTGIDPNEAERGETVRRTAGFLATVSHFQRRNDTVLAQMC